MLDQLPVVLYSHLRWDSVFERPHHLATRLARKRQVLFIEDPMPAEEGVPNSWDLQFPRPRLVICRPVLEERSSLAALRAMTEQLLRWQDVREHVGWLYTPLAYPVAQALRPAVTVYDCMDDLSDLGTPSELLRRREAELLSGADVVFAGGPSAYRAKCRLHSNVHCFPSASWEATLEGMMRELRRAASRRQATGTASLAHSSSESCFRLRVGGP